MYKGIQYLFLICSLVHFTEANAGSCVTFFKAIWRTNNSGGHFKYAKGRRDSSFFYPGQSSVRRVGEGAYGTVYRIELEDGGSMLVKNLKARPADGVSAEQVAKLELKKFSILKGLNLIEVKVPAAKVGKVVGTIEIEDIRGVSLDKVLQMSGLPDNIKLDLLLQFKRATQELEAKILQSGGRILKIIERGFPVEIGPMRTNAPIVFYEMADTVFTYSMIFSSKMDNFIVDHKDLSLHMVDPG